MLNWYQLLVEGEAGSDCVASKHSTILYILLAPNVSVNVIVPATIPSVIFGE
jgi:hypothetical protein